MAATAAKTVNLKRICTSCGTRFYDLGKRPIICPSCSTEFTGEVKLKGRKGRLPIENRKEDPIKESAVVESDEDILEEEDELEVVSLEDVEEDNGDDDDDATEIKIEDEDGLDDLPEFEDDLDEGDEEEILEDDDKD